MRSPSSIALPYPEFVPGNWKMSEPLTLPTEGPVAACLNAVSGDARRADSKGPCSLHGKPTGEEPVLRGGSTDGFGSRYYRYAN